MRFLRSIKAEAIVYCPLINREAAAAAKVLSIPGIALNTIAGPGALETAFKAACDSNLQDVLKQMNDFDPNEAAVCRLNERYDLNLRSKLGSPLGYEDTFSFASLHLVTTSEDLQDPMSEELEHAYAREDVEFAAVGPLLLEGAQRAGGHKLDGVQAHGAADCVSDNSILDSVQAARSVDRPVILVSMGTVITGDFSGVGWKSRGSQRFGLTGCELCQAAWAGVFDAFGASAADEGPLLVVAVGPQDNALGDISAPPNALCSPVLPQVDLLKAGVDLFLTHGGQNSFTESLMHGTPVVVCPGFGDQPVNAAKAVALGVGLKVDRPDPAEGAEAAAVAKAYREDVCRALLQVRGEPRFTLAAESYSKRLEAAGGVSRAVKLILDVLRRHELKNGREAEQERVWTGAAHAGA